MLRTPLIPVHRMVNVLRNGTADKLYIIGAPRSMTSFLHRTVVRSIGGDFYMEDTSGEYLNHQRCSWPLSCAHARYLSHGKYYFWTEDDRDRQWRFLQNFHRLPEFLVLKDVTFPHVTTDFVRDRNANTLLARKEIPLVAYSCIQNDWYYPCSFLDGDPSDELLVRALTIVERERFAPLAERDHVSGVSSADLQRDPDVLWNALERLGYELDRYDYVDAEFREKSAAVESYRETDLYGKLQRIYESVR